VNEPQYTDPFYSPTDFVWDYPGEPVPEPVWILLKQEIVRGDGKSTPHPRQITTPVLHHSVFTGHIETEIIIIIIIIIVIPKCYESSLKKICLTATVMSI